MKKVVPAGTRSLIFASLLCLLLVILEKPATAAVVFSGNADVNNTSVDVDAIFSTDGRGDLFITVVNSYSGPTANPSSLVTGLFFSGGSGLTPVNVSKGHHQDFWGQDVSKGPGISPAASSRQWEYLGGLSHAPEGATSEIIYSGYNFPQAGQFGIEHPNPLFGCGINDFSFEDVLTFELHGFYGPLGSIDDVNFKFGTSPGSVISSGVVPTPTVAMPEPNYNFFGALFLFPVISLSVWRSRAKSGLRMARISVR